MKEQTNLQKVGSMLDNHLQQQASKRIAETLELLEFGGMSTKQVDIIRKAMWRLFDELILIKKVGSNSNDKSSRS